MKILILSDIHAEFESISSTFTALQKAEWDTMCEVGKEADVVVLAGDTYTKGRGPQIAAEAFPGKKIIMLAGNHEYYGETYQPQLSKLQAQASDLPGIHYLENQAVEIGDVVFLGCTLWTDCKLWESGPHAGLYSYQQTLMDVQGGMTDYSRIRFQDRQAYRPLKVTDTIQIHKASVRWLKEQFEVYRGRKIVVVTHHAPSFRSIPESYQKDIISAGYASHLDELVESSGAILWVHGHTHSCHDYQIGQTRVICNARGYPGEQTGFQADLIVEVW